MEVVLPLRNKPSGVAPEKSGVSEEPANPNRATEMPFMNVRPLTEVHRTDPKKSQNLPAYKTQAPVEKGAINKEVAELIMNTPVGATVGQLLGSSPGLMKEVARHVTRIRIPTAPVAVNLNETASREDWYDTASEDGDTPADGPSENSWSTEGNPSATIREGTPEPDLFTTSGETFDRIRIQAEDLPQCTTFMVLAEDCERGQKGSIVITDPLVQYLDALSKDQKAVEIVYTAGESLGLRALYPLINSVDREEALLDSGSQIVSMAKTTATTLGITWDPGLTIGMQSAQGHVESTLGLARNVPFDFGGITLLMQVHIISNPAYSILLGRPFDALTESDIQNDKNGGQTVTITDPGTKKRLVLPTYERGKPPKELRREINQGSGQVFPASMS